MLYKKFDDPSIYNLDKNIKINNNTKNKNKKEINISLNPNPTNYSLVYMSLLNTLSLILSNCKNHEIDFYQTIIYPYFQEFMKIIEKYVSKQLQFYKKSEDNIDFLPLILNVINSLSYVEYKLVELSDNPIYLKLSIEMDENVYIYIIMFYLYSIYLLQMKVIMLIKVIKMKIIINSHTSILFIQSLTTAITTHQNHLQKEHYQ